MTAEEILERALSNLTAQAMAVAEDDLLRKGCATIMTYIDDNGEIAFKRVCVDPAEEYRPNPTKEG